MGTILSKDPQQPKATPAASVGTSHGSLPLGRAEAIKHRLAEAGQPKTTGPGGPPPRLTGLALAGSGEGRPPETAPKVGRAHLPPGAGKGFVVENTDGQAQCLVSEYRGNGIKEFVMPANEALQLDPNDVDCHIDEVHGPIQIKTWDGRRLKYEGTIPGLGPVGRAIMDEIMRAPGQLLTAGYLARNPRLTKTAEPWPRAAATMRLRRALGDVVAKNWYIFVVVQPWRIRWQRERSWRVIEPLAD